MKTKMFLTTTASVLASAFLGWAQENAAAPIAPVPPAANAPVDPAAPPVPPQPISPDTVVVMGGGGGVISTNPTNQHTTPDTGVLIIPGGGNAVGSDEATALDAFDPAREQQEVTAGVMEEENNLNLDAAIQRYLQAIARFDSRRPATAHAVFRLGECYRKMGRMEEAKVQYARILREFSDQESLVKASQTYLFGNSGRSLQTRLDQIINRRAAAIANKPAITGNAALDAMQSSFDKEIELLQKQIAETQKKVELGMAPTDDVDKLQRDLLKLRREKIAAAMVEDRKAMAAADTLPPVAVSDNNRKPASDVELLRQELLKAQEKVSAKQHELEEASLKQASVKALEKKPELLGSILGTDPIYMKLKEEYEMARLNTVGENASPETEKKATQAREKLAFYVRECCLPQLEEAVNQAKRALEYCRSTADVIKQRLAETEASHTLMPQTNNPVLKTERPPAAVSKSSGEASSPNEKH